MIASSVQAKDRSPSRDGMTLARMVPALTDRAVIVGQTGSGKTFLARQLLRYRKYVVVMDSKGTLRWPEYELHRSLRQLVASSAPRLLYRPSYEELQDGALIDQFFRWIYERRNTTVYVDETAAIVEGDVYPYHYGACFMRGRELGVEVWSSTQRPKRIPQIVLSESEHVYAFRLRLSQDRERVESLSGIEPGHIARLRKRQFLYAPQDSDIQGPFTLTME